LLLKVIYNKLVVEQTDKLILIDIT